MEPIQSREKQLRHAISTPTKETTSLNQVINESISREKADDISLKVPVPTAQEEKQGHQPVVDPTQTMEEKRRSSNNGSSSSLIGSNQVLNISTITEKTFNTSSLKVPVPIIREEKKVQHVIDKHIHFPNYFTEQVPLSSLKRRMNLLTPYTGCSIAAFQYNLGKHAHPEFNDCIVHCGKAFANTRGIRVDNAHLLVQANDTIFVQLNKLWHFVNNTMDKIDVDYVILSGNEHKVKPISKDVFDAIVNNPRILHVFMQNVDVYSHDLYHPKVCCRV